MWLRCDIKSQDDKQFENNVRKAEELGMPWGAYLLSYACSTADAKSELAHIDRLIKGQISKGYKPSLPVALDIEPTSYVENKGGWTATNLTNVATIILDGLTELNYYPMLYTGYYVLDNKVSDHIRNDYDCWFPQWYKKPDAYKYNRLSMWQYGGEINYLESNNITGVGVIDKNRLYKNYPEIIKNGGYNGWKRKTELNVLDTFGYVKGNASTGVYALKSLLKTAKIKGLISQGIDGNNKFGDGTEKAVNQFLERNGYTPNGIAGEKFIKLLAEKLNIERG